MSENYDKLKAQKDAILAKQRCPRCAALERQLADVRIIGERLFHSVADLKAKLEQYSQREQSRLLEHSAIEAGYERETANLNAQLKKAREVITTSREGREHDYAANCGCWMCCKDRRALAALAPEPAAEGLDHEAADALVAEAIDFHQRTDPDAIAALRAHTEPAAEKPQMMISKMSAWASHRQPHPKCGDCYAHGCVPFQGESDGK